MMRRCCTGQSYVVPNGDRVTIAAWAPGESVARPITAVESWAVLCGDCDVVLAVVDGPRDEVYACL